MLLANVAESVLYIFEERYPSDKRPRLAIEGIRDWHAGKITSEELARLRADVYAADDARKEQCKTNEKLMREFLK